MRRIAAALLVSLAVLIPANSAHASNYSKAVVQASSNYSSFSNY